MDRAERSTRELKESEAKFRELANQSLAGSSSSKAASFSYSNAKFDEMFGYTAEEMRRIDPLDLVAEADRPLVAESMRGAWPARSIVWSTAFTASRRTGTPIDVEIHASSMRVNGERVLISVLLDVTERMRADHEMAALQQKLADQSVHDALTGLYNRRYLEDALARELILAERHNHPVSVIMADLDLFKRVNDQYGHLAGDEVLRSFSAVTEAQCAGQRHPLPLWREEFLLVLPQMSAENAAMRAEQLRRTVAAAPIPVRHDGDRHHRVVRRRDLPDNAGTGTASSPPPTRRSTKRRRTAATGSPSARPKRAA